MHVKLLSWLFNHFPHGNHNIVLSCSPLVLVARLIQYNHAVAYIVRVGEQSVELHPRNIEHAAPQDSCPNQETQNDPYRLNITSPNTRALLLEAGIGGWLASNPLLVQIGLFWRAESRQLPLFTDREIISLFISWSNWFSRLHESCSIAAPLNIANRNGITVLGFGKGLASGSRK